MYNKTQFSKAQIAAFSATIVDYIVVIGLTELLGLWYVYSNTIGATCGGVSNFLLGRYWSFRSAEDNMPGQAFRYFIVFLGSVFLNTLGVFIFTENTPLSYIFSKVIIAIFIAFTYNYLMQKLFVFRR